MDLLHIQIKLAKLGLLKNWISPFYFIFTYCFASTIENCRAFQRVLEHFGTEINNEIKAHQNANDFIKIIDEYSRIHTTNEK